MWSGPRNLSTAMMRAFGNRTDCAVWDEPFYAAYLAATGLDHPMRDEVMAAGETDPARVAERCVGPAPDGKALFYQKHMTHHMISGFGRDWIFGLVNVFLIREPERVVASYAAKREAPTLDDIGFLQQADLFASVADRTGSAPPVVDAADIRRAPGEMLRALCAAIGIGFDPAMLAWLPGPRETDGVWGAHWYDAVNRSSGFAPAEDAPPVVDGEAARTAAAARPAYDAMRAHALRPSRSLSNS